MFSEVLSNNNKSELPTSSGENRNLKQKKRRYVKEKSMYPSKDTEKLSKKNSKK